MIAPNDGGGGNGQHRQKAFPFHTDLSVLDLSVTGYWFCRSCQKILLDGPEFDKGPQGICPKCNSPRVHWNKPVPAPEIPLPSSLNGKC